MTDNESTKLEYPITENYSPQVTIEVLGVKDDKNVVAVVDTGYTGFLQIPLSVGIACNLRLWGTGQARLADGSRVRNLQCVGQIRFAGREMLNIISLSEGGEDCLLGMQFLNEINMDFTVSPTDKKAIFVSRRIDKKESTQTEASANMKRKKTK